MAVAGIPRTPVPRVKCPTCGVVKGEPPRSRLLSGLTPETSAGVRIEVMATQPIQGEVFRLDRLFRSDILPSLRRFFDASPELSHLVERRILQIRAIVDANVVQRELRWRLGFREKPDARSGLEEAIDAGVLVLIAPDFLKLEIEKYLLAMADQSGVTLADAQREWELFQAKLCFYRPLSQVTEGMVVDPKDLPYKYASDDLALPVYTQYADLMILVYG